MISIQHFFIIVSLFLSVNVSAQEKVILDTDPSYDPDDVGCMAMLHTMANLGECEILAIINSTNHRQSSLSISAINLFYNRKAIPVGDYKGYTEKIDAPILTYDHHLAEAYPRTLASWEDAIDGVVLYREILESAAEKSITIVIIGTMHNFYSLLQSKADEISEKAGKELVAAKVKKVVTMGGNFIDGNGLDRTNWGGADALCSYTDWSCLNEERNRMCRYVIENCSAPFIASGWEVGCGDYHDANYGNVMTGQGLKQLDTTNIIRRSYEYHFRQRGGDADISRHSNDQCALHYAIRGECENYEAYLNGKITLSESGVCQWSNATNRQQGYIQKKRDKNLIAQEIEKLMMGDVLQADQSPPNAPTNISIQKKGKNKVVSWDAANDTTKGSWIVGYRIYKNGEPHKIVYGRKFTFRKGRRQRYSIRAINTNGLESANVNIK